MESKPSNNATSSVNSSETVNLSLPEAPLIGLCPKPVHLMTSEEKREHLAKIRNYRGNPAGWRSAVADESSPKGETIVDTVNQEKANTISDSLGDLLK